MAKKSTTNGVPPAKRTGMYFLSLTVENTRCFGTAQTLNLTDSEGRPARWTILLGENGTGKTTILRILAGFDQIDTKSTDIRENHPYYRAEHHFRNGVDFSRELLRAGAGNAFAKARYVVTNVIADSKHDTHRFESQLTYLANGALEYVSRQLEDTEFHPYDLIDSVLYAYGSSRRLGSSTLAEKSDDDPAGSLFTDKVELRNAEEWLLRLDYSASKQSPIQQQQQARLDQVRRLLVDILPDVEEIRFTIPEAAHPTPRVEFQTPYGWVPLSGLGYGYQSVIAWVTDLASRMVERYPDSPNPLAEPAIVLVDEIDLHLHPTWQRTLIGFLTERFPNTQFIATAHSPLVVQAAKDANIAVLRREGDHVVIDNDVDSIRGWLVDQILTSDLFGLTTARPPEYEQALARRAELASKPKRTRAEETELKRLDERVADLPAGETATMAKELRAIQGALKLLEEREKATK